MFKCWWEILSFMMLIQLSFCNLQIGALAMGELTFSFLSYSDILKNIEKLDFQVIPWSKRFASCNCI